VWLLFIGLYVAGFDAWLSEDKVLSQWDFVALRLGLGTTTFAVLTYLMVLLEPKDRVLYRWLGSRFGSGRIISGFANLQAWMSSYVATVVLGIALIVWVGQHGGPAVPDQLLLIAALGFFTRDVGIFVLMQTLSGQRRGDLGALAVLFSLYVLIPAILNGMGAQGALPFFYPLPSNPAWLVTAAGWAEAIAVIVLTAGRLAISDKPAASAQPA
jgi:hypothetical protein